MQRNLWDISSSAQRWPDCFVFCWSEFVLFPGILVGMEHKLFSEESSQQNNGILQGGKLKIQVVIFLSRFYLPVNYDQL